MEIISPKQKEECNATTFIINILELHTNSFKPYQGNFACSFEILITNVQALTHSFYFDFIFCVYTF